MFDSTVHIGLGSNLGDRLGHLHEAVNRLADSPGVRVLQTSSVYESAAHVLPGAALQPDYLNAILVCQTSLGPEQLLHLCLTIEESLGRVRSEGVRWEPRTLDLDILIWGDRMVDVPALTIPHPRLDRRAFVLLPLAEIDMDLIIPSPFDCTVRYLLLHCSEVKSTVQTPFQLSIPPFE